MGKNLIPLFPVSSQITNPHSPHYMSLFNLPAPGFLYQKLGLPESLRKSLISELFSPDQKDSEGKIGATGSGQIDRKIRAVSTVHYSSPNRKLFEITIEEKISELVNKQITPCGPWGYFKYSSASQGHYDWHSDEGHIWPDGKIVINYPCRALSAVYYPNSNYEGGQIEIGERPHKYPGQPPLTNFIKPEFDHILLFPSDIRFPHKVHPVIQGDRLSIVNWFDIK